MKRMLLLLVFILFTLVFPTSARADGIIIPDPPICDPGPCPHPIPTAQLAIRYHHVTVKIQDQVAVTHVDQVFYNPNKFQVEGTYIFPIPKEATVSSFTLWIDSKPVEGQILDANKARQTYEDIVRRTLDPALLEYADRGAMRARIFPIPPEGERRIELEYTQVLVADNGLVHYVYPLNTEKFSTMPLDDVTISVDVRASVPIRAVYSPSHTIGISRENDFHVTAGYEETNVLPNTDFALYYSLGAEEAFHLLSYRDPMDTTDADGFFLLLLAPRPDSAAQVLPKDLFLVLDHSGSMEGAKFQQAQEALRYILKHLNPDDRFNIITFSTGVETYADDIRPASDANNAIGWVGRLNAQGSTDINRALLETAVMTDRERPTYLIFLTDGLPTQGEVESQKILDNLKQAAPDNMRLFTFGVGYDVDTFLLDSLAQEHHGTSTYISPVERLDEILSTFYAKISTPVLTNLNIDFGSLSTYDLYPAPIPDLFSGSQLILVGRYREGGTTEVTLSGDVNGNRQTFRFLEQAFTKDSRGDNEVLQALPRLWATRKIGYLLSQIRLHGPDQETIDQIVHLSVRCGIVTPYTSYLVTENQPLGAAAQERIAGEQYNQMQAAPTAAPSGQDAVRKAAEQGSLAGASVPEAPPAEAADLVRIIGSRTFVFTNGTWVDTAFDPETMRTVKVSFLSEDYFALVKSRPELAAAFALGERVIALSDGKSYEVVSTGTPAGPVVIPPTFPPGPTAMAPTEPVKTITPPLPTATPAPGSLPCTGSLLPLVMLLLGFIAKRTLKH